MKRLIVLGAVGVMFAAVIAAQSRQPAGTSHNGKAFRFNKVKDGVYHAVGTGSLAVVGNSSFIVNDNDVIVVDDHVSPAAAWVLLEEIKEVTNKPVTTVINTHFHFDHAHGNQIFAPNVQIIGHEYTRRMLLSNSIGMPLYQNYLTAMPGQIDALKKRIASEADPAAKAKLQTQLQVAENNYASQKELKPTPPNVTLSTQMTLYRGSREIQIRYLGRGHTAGDVVVLICRGPMGSGMEETYQVTSALKYLSFGKHVAVLTDARFSGVSTGACIGHVSPEALAGGPIGKVCDGDRIQIVIDRNKLEGTVDLIGEGATIFGPEEGKRVLARRPESP